MSNKLYRISFKVNELRSDISTLAESETQCVDHLKIHLNNVVHVGAFIEILSIEEMPFDSATGKPTHTHQAV